MNVKSVGTAYLHEGIQMLYESFERSWPLMIGPDGHSPAVVHELVLLEIK